MFYSTCEQLGDLLQALQRMPPVLSLSTSFSGLLLGHSLPLETSSVRTQLTPSLPSSATSTRPSRVSPPGPLVASHLAAVTAAAANSKGVMVAPLMARAPSPSARGLAVARLLHNLSSRGQPAAVLTGTTGRLSARALSVPPYTPQAPSLGDVTVASPTPSIVRPLSPEHQHETGAPKVLSMLRNALVERPSTSPPHLTKIARTAPPLPPTIVATLGTSPSGRTHRSMSPGHAAALPPPRSPGVALRAPVGLPVGGRDSDISSSAVYAPSPARLFIKGASAVVASPSQQV